LSFISSPEMVVAYAVSGSLSFNPMTDTLKNAAGEQIKLSIPQGDELPKAGFAPGLSGYQAPPTDGAKEAVAVNPQSQRLALLEEFKAWDGKDFLEHLLLVKTQGKTTTDHISPAGKWLKFRGHLDKISDNMLIGATNAFDAEIGHCRNPLDKTRATIPQAARTFKAAGKRWVIVGDENYGEGSSREHAAMSPRFLGGSTVLVRSFARIHETNLKKQGMLALTFKTPADYSKVREDDKISVLGLEGFAPGKPLTVRLTHADGSKEEILASHTYNDEQIRWFRAGSALNMIKQKLPS
jgi:aconitate hydratase